MLKIWLERIGKDELMQFESETLRHKYHVCLIHFIKQCLNGRRLAKYSLPTVKIPGELQICLILDFINNSFC